MVVSKKPSHKQIHDLIKKGGEVAKTKNKMPIFVQLRLDHATLEAIDADVQASDIRVSRHAWIVSAINMKLKQS